MSVPRLADKAPADVDQYIIDWSDLLDTTESITSVLFAVDPVETGGIVVEASAFSTPEASVILSGGVTGTLYTLSCTITTDLLTPTRTLKRDFKLKVKNL
ncbi:MAG: hypothetical protein ACR2NL_06875 [Acidimicrobiia bacterium]